MWLKSVPIAILAGWKDHVLEVCTHSNLVQVRSGIWTARQHGACGMGSTSTLYMVDLRQLESFTPAAAPDLPQELQEVVTPLRTEAWSHVLRQHPDREFVDYILRGIR